MAHAYNQDIAEREYLLSSTSLELATAKRHIKVLEVQRSALTDDVESGKAEYEVLVAQLGEEQDSGDALKRELTSLRKALQHAAAGLAEADGEISRLAEDVRDANENAARRIANAGTKHDSQTLARAEARLEEVTRGEAALAQRLIFEREAKEALEETCARERSAAARAGEDANRSAGEAAALRRELTEQKGAQHELQRLLAERNGALSVLKSQLADAEGKYESGRAGTEPELRGRLHEVERRANEMARELGSKGAALQALERQLGERTAEAATERERAERSRGRVRELEKELRQERSKESSSGGGGGSDMSGRSNPGAAEFRRAEKEKPAPTAKASPPRFPAGKHVTSRPEKVKEKPVPKEKPKPKPKAVGPSKAAAAAAAAVAAANELETSGDGSLGSLFAAAEANATVVNVLDHLSLSGYVSPLAKPFSSGNKAIEDARDPVASKAKAKAKAVAAAFETAADVSEAAVSEPIETPSETEPVAPEALASASEETPSFDAARNTTNTNDTMNVAKNTANTGATIDISAPLDPNAFDDDASTEEIETEDTGEEVNPTRVTRSAREEGAPGDTNQPTTTPGERPSAGKTPKGPLIGGLRMPLANIGQKRREGETRGSGEGGDETRAETKKKRKLLNQVTVGGETPGKHPSLLFGAGDDFSVPKPGGA